MTTTLTPPALAEGSLLELKTQVESGGQEDATVMVRWCTKPLLAERIADEGALKPFVLLVVRPYQVADKVTGRRSYSDPTQTKLVPLVDEASYLSFSRPGLNEIFACVVYHPENKGKHELGGVFTRSQAVYHQWVLDSGLFEYDGSFVPGQKRVVRGRTVYKGIALADSNDHVDVDVSDKLFAKEYPKWVKLYLSKFSLDNAKNQCSMRKRVIALGLLSPLVFAFAYTRRLVLTIFGVIVGLRRIRFQDYLHPLKTNAQDIIPVPTTSIWFRKSDGSLRSPVFWPFNLITPLLLGTVLWIVGTIHVTRNEQIVGIIGWEWWQYYALAFAVHIAAAMVFLAVAVVVAAVILILSKILGTSISAAISKFFSSLARDWRAERRFAREAEEQRRLEELEEQIAAMACGSGSSLATLSALPSEKRTVRLRAQEMKRKVCKPYAR